VYPKMKTTNTKAAIFAILFIIYFRLFGS
jgi:hypothetical protein